MDDHHPSKTSTSAPVLSRSLVHRYLARRANGSQPVAVIAVVACVAGLFALLVLWRILVYRRRHRDANPLPPVQPLAHVRKHEAIMLMTEPKIDWPHSNQHHRTTSDASLLHTTTSTWITDASPDVSVSSSLNNEPALPPNELPLPHPPYFPAETQQHGSTHSRNASVSSIDSSSGYRLAPKPKSMSASASRPPSRSVSRSHSRARAPSRSHSVMSTTTDISRRSSRSRGRVTGAPHAPGNNMVIVLPKPLAPELYPYDSLQESTTTVDATGITRTQSVLVPDDNPGSGPRGLSDRWLSTVNLSNTANVRNGGESRSGMNIYHIRSRSLHPPAPPPPAEETPPEPSAPETEAPTEPILTEPSQEGVVTHASIPTVPSFYLQNLDILSLPATEPLPQENTDMPPPLPSKTSLEEHVEVEVVEPVEDINYEVDYEAFRNYSEGQ